MTIAPCNSYHNKLVSSHEVDCPISSIYFYFILAFPEYENGIERWISQGFFVISFCSSVVIPFVAKVEIFHERRRIYANFSCTLTYFWYYVPLPWGSNGLFYRSNALLWYSNALLYRLTFCHDVQMFCSAIIIVSWSVGLMFCSAMLPPCAD